MAETNIHQDSEYLIGDQHNIHLLQDVVDMRGNENHACVPDEVDVINIEAFDKAFDDRLKNIFKRHLKQGLYQQLYTSGLLTEDHIHRLM